MLIFYLANISIRESSPVSIPRHKKYIKKEHKFKYMSRHQVNPGQYDKCLL